MDTIPFIQITFSVSFQQTVSQWRIVFIIAAINSIAGTIVYMLFGTSKEQPWNKYGKSDKENGQEMQKLTAKPIVKCEEGNGNTDAHEKEQMLADK